MRRISDTLPEINNHRVTEMKPSCFLTRWKYAVSRCEETFSLWREELLSHCLSENSPWDLKDACPDVSSACSLSQGPSSSPRYLTSMKWPTQNDSTPGDLSSTYREGCRMHTENKSVAGTQELCQCAHHAMSPTGTTVSARHHERIRGLHPSPWTPEAGSGQQHTGSLGLKRSPQAQADSLLP